MKDEYNLQRFIGSQDQVYAAVLEELRAGEKRGHWMWYIFPQIKGLGHSVMAQQFAVTSQEEAKAYLEHPILGSRLRECTRLVLNVEGRSAEQIFYYPDNLKFRSCMTLFMDTTSGNNIFQEALLKYFEGQPDESTLDILRRSRL
jgi:uncharacterized protein (DUF1810 family)